MTQRRVNRRWLSWSALAMLITASIAILLAASALRRSGPDRSLAQLMQTSGPTRPTLVRLSPMAQWSPPPALARGTATGERPSLEALTAALDIERALRQERSARNLQAHAIAQLVLGQPIEARAALEEAAQVAPGNPSIWTDLAAACYVKAVSLDDAIDLPRGLEAADRALALRGDDAAAWFNKALILERLNVRGETVAAWKQVVALDHQVGWQTEAREHLADFAAPASEQARDLQSLREALFDDTLSHWGDAMLAGATTVAATTLAEAERAAAMMAQLSPDRLASDAVGVIGRLPASARVIAARGHAAYGEARRRYRRDDFEGAAPFFADASRDLESLRSPAALLARVHTAILDYRRQRYPTAIAAFQALIADIGGRPYPSVRGRAEWVHGLTLEVSGFERTATPHYEASVRDLQAAAELANVSFVKGLLASQFDRLGDPVRAWRAWVEAAQGATREGTLLNAAISATEMEWNRAALDLQHAAVDLARTGGRPPVLADSLRSYAITASKLNLADTARSALDEARGLAATRPGAAWDRIRAEIDLAESTSSLIARAPVRVASSTRALAFFQQARATGRLPEVLLARAMARQAAGDEAGAAADLKDGIRTLAELRRQVAPGIDQMTFADVARRLIGAFVEIEDRAGRLREAFEAVEDARARDLPGDTPAFSLTALEQAIPDNAVFADFVVGDERSLAWLVRRTGSTVVHLPVGRAELASLVTAAGPPLFDRDATLRLYRLILAPVVSTLPADGLLVVVPDGPLHGVAFAMLPGERAPYLIEEHPVLIAPGGRMWLSTSTRLAQNDPSPRRAFVAGNPQLDPRKYPNLPLLRNAEEEARQVAGLYGVPPVLGSAVTPAAVAAAGDAQVIHFAGHAIVNQIRPAASELVVWDPDGPGLTASAIRALHYSQTRLVVLAACETASGAMTRTEGAMGLARAFLAAGAPTVVANHWMVDDRASAALMLRFHQRYLATGNAVESLRQAQLALLHSEDESLRAPRVWAGFAAFGGAPFESRARSPHN